DKSKPLGAILRDRGALDAGEHELLDALVQKHLARHGDDPRRSLAALAALDTPARRGLAAVAGADVRGSLVGGGAAGLTAAAPGVPPPDPIPRSALPQPPPTAAHYRVLRSHARGGLGEVYVAEDTELGRHVALKEIQARHADNDRSRRRFVLEAEI